MHIESNLGDKGIYVVDCVNKEYLDKLIQLEKTLKSIEQLHYYRCAFELDKGDLSTYLKTNINAAIIEYLNRSNKDKSEYILKNHYTMSHWMLGKSLAPHIDTIKYDHEDTHTPRSIINALLYVTDDYEDGEITFPEIGMEIRPKAGSVVVFDADLMHGVNAVKSGTRKTLASNLYSIYSEDIEEVKAHGWRTL
jgi:predicted 2-oxoglutarate/Fe(II)-dependent dioxygenase YbiX